MYYVILSHIYIIMYIFMAASTLLRASSFDGVERKRPERLSRSISLKFSPSDQSSVSATSPILSHQTELVARIENLLAEKAYDRAEMYALEGQLAAIKAADRSLRSDLERERERIVSQENALIEYENQIQDLEEELQDLTTPPPNFSETNENSEVSDSTRDLMTRLQQLESELSFAYNRIGELERDCQYEKSAKIELETQLQEIQGSQGDAADYSKSNEIENENAAIIGDASKLRSQISALEKENEELKDRLVAVQMQAVSSPRYRASTRVKRTDSGISEFSTSENIRIVIPDREEDFGGGTLRPFDDAGNNANNANNISSNMQSCLFSPSKIEVGYRNSNDARSPVSSYRSMKNILPLEQQIRKLQSHIEVLSSDLRCAEEVSGRLQTENTLLSNEKKELENMLSMKLHTYTNRILTETRTLAHLDLDSKYNKLKDEYEKFKLDKLSEIHNLENRLLLIEREKQSEIFRLESRLTSMESKCLQYQTMINDLENQLSSGRVNNSELLQLKMDLSEANNNITSISRKLELAIEGKRLLEETIAKMENEHKLRWESWMSERAAMNTIILKLKDDLQVSMASRPDPISEETLRRMQQSKETAERNCWLLEDQVAKLESQLKRLNTDYSNTSAELINMRAEQAALIEYLEGSAKTLRKRVDEWEDGLEALHAETMRSKSSLSPERPSKGPRDTLRLGHNQASSSSTNVMSTALVSSEESNERQRGSHNRGTVVDSAVTALKSELSRVMSQRASLETEVRHLKRELQSYRESKVRNDNVVSDRQYGLESRLSVELAAAREAEAIARTSLVSLEMENNELSSRLARAQFQLEKATDTIRILENRKQLDADLIRNRLSGEDSLETHWLKTSELGEISLRDELSSAKSQISTLQKQLSRADEKIRSLETQMQTVNQTNTDTNYMKITRAEVRQMEETIKNLTKENEELAEKIRVLADERVSLIAKNKSLEEDLMHYKRRVSDAEKRLDEDHAAAQRMVEGERAKLNALDNSYKEKLRLLFRENTFLRERDSIQSFGGSRSREHEQSSLKALLLPPTEGDEDVKKQLQRAYERIVYLEEERQSMMDDGKNDRIRSNATVSARASYDVTDDRPSSRRANNPIRHSWNEPMYEKRHTISSDYQTGDPRLRLSVPAPRQSSTSPNRPRGYKRSISPNLSSSGNGFANRDSGVPPLSKSSARILRKSNDLDNDVRPHQSDLYSKDNNRPSSRLKLRKSKSTA